MVPVPPPRNLPAFPDARKVRPKTGIAGGGFRRRWKDSSNGTIYEWDYQHGSVEAYDSRGRHLGQFDPHSGDQQKGPDLSRRIEP